MSNPNDLNQDQSNTGDLNQDQSNTGDLNQDQSNTGDLNQDQSNTGDLNQDQSNSGDLNQDEVLENEGTSHAISMVAKVIGARERDIRAWIRGDSSLPDDTRKWLDETIQGGLHLDRINEEHSIATKYDAVMRCSRQSVGAVSNDLHLPYSVVNGWVENAEEIKEQYKETFRTPQVAIQPHEATSTSTETDEAKRYTDALLLLDFARAHFKTF